MDVPLRLLARDPTMLQGGATKLKNCSSKQVSGENRIMSSRKFLSPDDVRHSG